MSEDIIPIQESKQPISPSKLLISEPPLQVLPSLAVKIGLNEAIMLQQIHYWSINPFNKHIHDGRVWVAKTHKDLKESFPFWSIRTIRYILEHLEKLELVMSSSKLNESWSDRKKSYSINYENLDKLDFPKTRPTRTNVSNMSHVAIPATCHVAIPATCHVAIPATSLLERYYKENNNTEILSDLSYAKPIEAEESVVVELKKVGLIERQAIRLIEKHGIEKVSKIMRDMRNTDGIRNPAGYLLKALEEEWEISNRDKVKQRHTSPIPSVEETRAMLYGRFSGNIPKACPEKQKAVMEEIRKMLPKMRV